MPSVSGSAAGSGRLGAEARGAGKTEGAPELPARQFNITAEHEDLSDLPVTMLNKNGAAAAGAALWGQGAS